MTRAACIFGARLALLSTLKMSGGCDASVALDTGSPHDGGTAAPLHTSHDAEVDAAPDDPYDAAIFVDAEPGPDADPDAGAASEPDGASDAEALGGDASPQTTPATLDRPSGFAGATQ